MKNKKGFTLIELLAVIVILSIIMVIAVPKILNIIEESEKKSYENSVNLMVEAAKLQYQTKNMKGEKIDLPLVYTYKENKQINIEEVGELLFKGDKPNSGTITVNEEGKIEVEKLVSKNKKWCAIKEASKAEATVGKASELGCIVYDKENKTVELTNGEIKEEKKLHNEDETSFDVNNIEGKTNIVCNNGAIPKLENKTLTISNVHDDTVCEINTNLKETISKIDNSENNIVMINDLDITDTITIDEGKNVILDLNGKTITLSGSTLSNSGNLTINNSKNDGKIISEVYGLNNSNVGTLIINSGTFTSNGVIVSNYGKTNIKGGTFISGDNSIAINYNEGTFIIEDGYFEKTNGTSTMIYNRNKGNMTINSGTFISNAGLAIGNGNSSNTENGSLTIKGGSFSTTNNNVVVSNYGTTDISGGTFISDTNNVVNNCGQGVLTINDGYYERTAGTGDVVFNRDTGKIIINQGTFNSNQGKLIANGMSTNEKSGTITINGGTYNSDNITITNYGTTNINGGTFISNKNVITNAGIMNINGKNNKIYMSSLATTFNPVIKNSDVNGVLNIKAKNANKCTTNSEDTTEGLCVYAEGDKNWSSDTSNAAVTNTDTGIINIDGGTYFGGYTCMSNHQNGIVNIKNASISSNNFGILEYRTGTINICNATINSLKYDLYASSNITENGIYYSNNVVFTDGTNNPSIGGVSSFVHSNYTGTCGD